MEQESEKKKSNMISLDALNKVSKSVCKIIYRKGNKKWTGTGFFMNIKYENQVLINCLLTNYHTLDPHRCYTSIQLQIGDIKKDFNIRKKKRYSKYYKGPIDIAMIEILEDDGLIENVDFLSYDLNYIEYGYHYYLNKEIFILQHPYGEEMHSANGKIIRIKDYEFEHNAGSCKGSSGSPVILIENNCVIGIHKGMKKYSENRIGTFIGKLFEEIVIDSKLQRRLDKLKNQINFETNEIKNEEPQNITNNSESLSQKDDNEDICDKNNIELETENSNKNTLILKYKIQENKPYVNLFSKKFATPSGKKFVMFINNEQKKLCCQLDISKMNIINNILEVKLKKIDKVQSFQYMFKETDLMSVSGFSSFDPDELINISSMFKDCANLSSIKDIDCLNTSKVVYMNHMFYKCKSLESLPDISKWDTSNATHIDYMFDGCEKLKSLPDISKWNTSNVTQMNRMFSDCKSLISLPDISKWRISNVEDLSKLFLNCESLLSIPDIQRWNISKTIKINSMFCGCKSLKSIPDISKWKTNKVKDMANLFRGCENIAELPEISNWKTNNLEKMTRMFKDCKSLRKNPDIKFWNKKHVNDRKKFYNKVYDYEE